MAENNGGLIKFYKITGAYSNYVAKQQTNNLVFAKVSGETDASKTEYFIWANDIEYHIPTQEAFEQLLNSVGTLSALTTNAKDNLVNAINELNTNKAGIVTAADSSVTISNPTSASTVIGVNISEESGNALRLLSGNTPGLYVAPANIKTSGYIKTNQDEALVIDPTQITDATGSTSGTYTNLTTQGYIDEKIDDIKGDAISAATTTVEVANNIGTFTTEFTKIDGTTTDDTFSISVDGDLTIETGSTSGIVISYDEKVSGATGYLTLSGKNVTVNETLLATPTGQTYTTSTGLTTQGYVDEQVNAAIVGGVKYKGTVSDTLPTGTTENGDMYKTTANSASGVVPTWKAGDVIIYRVNGGTGTWDVIEAGDDVEYTGINVGNTVIIEETVGGVATFAAETGNTALITVSGDAQNKTVTYTSTQKLQDAIAIAESALTNITITSTTPTYVTVSAGTPSNNTQQIQVGVSAITSSDNTTYPNTGLATDGYVAEQIANFSAYSEGNGINLTPSGDTTIISVETKLNDYVTVAADGVQLDSTQITNGIIASSGSTKLVREQDVYNAFVWNVVSD